MGFGTFARTASGSVKKWIRKRAPAAKKWARKKIMEKLPELIPGIKPHMDTIQHVGSLVSLASRSMMGAKAMAAPMFGHEIASPGTGNISRTEFQSRIHKLRTSKQKAISAAMGMAQRFEVIVQSAYRLVTSSDSQGVADMYTAQSASSGIFPQGGIYTGDIFLANSSKNSGALTSLTANLYANDQVTTNSTQGTSRVLQKYCFLETEISNLTNYPVDVDIYEVVAKHDLQGANFTGSNYLQGGEVWSPAYYWNLGMQNYQSSNFGSKSIYTTLGTFPTSSELFNCYWKIQSRFKVSLSTGGVHIHESKYNMDTVIDDQRAQYSGIIGGVTRNILIVATGTPVRDSTNQNNVALGPVVVNVVHTATYRAEGIPYNRMTSSLLNYTNAITTAETTVQSSPTTSSALTPD